jgi:hypothetical protein
MNQTSVNVSAGTLRIQILERKGRLFTVQPPVESLLYGCQLYTFYATHVS